MWLGSAPNQVWNHAAKTLFYRAARLIRGRFFFWRNAEARVPLSWGALFGVAKWNVTCLLEPRDDALLSPRACSHCYFSRDCRAGPSPSGARRARADLGSASPRGESRSDAVVLWRGGRRRVGPLENDPVRSSSGEARAGTFRRNAPPALIAQSFRGSQARCGKYRARFFRTSRSPRRNRIPSRATHLMLQPPRRRALTPIHSPSPCNVSSDVRH